METITQSTRYTVETIRAGQPRPYADSEYEYIIRVEATEVWGKDKGQLKPWVLLGDVEAQIRKEEALRKAGKMHGGNAPDELRKMQRDWAKVLVRALCRNFRERGDADGIEEGTIEAHFAPTLKRLDIDGKAGTIRALIIVAYTD